MPILNRRSHTAFPIPVLPIPVWPIPVLAILVLAILVLLAAGPFAAAQSPAAEPAPPAPAPADISTGPALAGLRPALGQAGAAVANLRIPHWKVPADIRTTSLEDVSSIQRDIGITLPPMLDQAESASSPGAPLAPSFAIFRNIDALYDVLLRVTEMANLAGSTLEARRLEDARAALESARAQLADSLLASVTAQDAQIARLRAQIIAAVKAPPPPPRAKVVVEDGSAAPKVRRRRKKRVPKPVTPAAHQTPPAHQ